MQGLPPAPRPAAGPAARDVARRASRGALQLGLRTVLLRLVTAIGTLVLARLLAPEDFGIYAFAWFWVVVILAVGDGGMNAALVQQRDEPDRRTVGTAWAVQQAVGVGGFLVVWLIAPLAAELALARADGVDLLRVLAISLPIVTLRAMPTALLERALRFGPIAAGEVAGQAAFYGLAIVGALAGLGAWAFIYAAVGHAVCQTAVVLAAWRQPPPLAFERRELGRLLGLGFPLQLSVALTWLRDAVIPWAGVIVAGPATGGFLHFAWRIGTIMSSAEEIIGRVAFPALSRLRHAPAEFRRAAGLSTRVSLLVSAPLLLWAAATSHVLVPVVFGEPWRPAATLLSLVCIGSLARFPVRVIRQAAFAMGFGRRALAMTAAVVLATVAPTVVLLPIAGLTGAGIGFVAGSSAAIGLTVAIGGNVAPLPALAVARIVASSAGGALAAWLIVAWAPNLAGLVASGLIAGGWAAVSATLFERHDLHVLVGILRGADAEATAVLPGA